MAEGEGHAQPALSQADCMREPTPMALPSTRHPSRVSLHSISKETFPQRHRSASNASEESLSTTMDFYGINHKSPHLRRSGSVISNHPTQVQQPPDELDTSSKNAVEHEGSITASDHGYVNSNTFSNLGVPIPSFYSPRTASRNSNLSIPAFASPNISSSIRPVSPQSQFTPSASWQTNFRPTSIDISSELPRRVGNGPLITRIASPFAAGSGPSYPLVARDPKIGYKLWEDNRKQRNKEQEAGEDKNFDVMQFVMQDENSVDSAVKKVAVSPFPTHRRNPTRTADQNDGSTTEGVKSDSSKHGDGVQPIFGSAGNGIRVGNGNRGPLSDRQTDDENFNFGRAKVSGPTKLEDLLPPEDSIPLNEKVVLSSSSPKRDHVAVSVAPRLDEKGRMVRNFETHAGNNRFFLNGRILTSGDNPIPFILCLVVAVLLPVLFFGFSGPFLWHRLGGGGKASLLIFAWLTAVMWTNMCVAAWRDPGIIPRNLDKAPQRKWVEDLNGEGEGGWRAEARVRKLREGTIASKWCETCETYRPPRTSHCRLCNNCVEHTDHHCTFLNNCIGRRNYVPFFAFLVSAVITGIYAISFSAWHISQRHKDSLNPKSEAFGTPWSSRSDVVGSFIVIIFTFCLLVPMIGLLCYHLNLLWHNRTTIEMLRPKEERSGAIDPATGKPMGNLFSLSSPFRNMTSILCGPIQTESYIQPRAFARQEVDTPGE